jgi:hypothetical protein
MATRDIRTFHETIVCDMCGRTLLRGERADVYLAGGSRREVCELCSDRAVHEGWVREDAALELPERSPARNRRGTLLGRWRHRREEREATRREQRATEAIEVDGLDGAAAAPAEAVSPVARERAAGPQRTAEPEPAADPERTVEPEPAPEREPAAEHEPPPRPRRARAGAARQAPERGEHEPRHVRAVPSSSEQQVAAALELFNGTEHIRTVGGVARSLGAPAVAARALGGSGRVSIVASWELCWYRYEVELGEGGPGVHQAAQGYELSELPPEDRVPNAVCDEYGQLHPAGAR